MDPVTHALAGAAAARAASSRFAPPAAAGPLLAAGVFGALLPDADRLIHSAADPLLHIEVHRHFTHALAFIPIGGAIAALPWLLARRRRPHWRAFLLAATAGYATHGLLDATTTYGTLLLWPFSDHRLALNWISIVDPLFTLILIGGVAAAVWRRSPAPAAMALGLCVLYLGLGTWQRERALDVQRRVASARGHVPVRGEVFPGFANNVIWRSLYEAEGTLYMDRLRVPWTGKPTWSPGASVPALLAEDLDGDLSADARRRRDFRRFSWFSSGWVARSAVDPEVLGDARYSLSTVRFEPVWGIRFVPGREPPVAWVDHSRGRRVDLRELWAEIAGRHPQYRPVPEP